MTVDDAVDFDVEAGGGGRRGSDRVIGRDGRCGRSCRGGGCRGRGRRARRFRLALPRLDAVFAHGQRSVDPVELVVEAAGVADRLALGVAAPQGRRRRPAVGAA